MCVETKSFDNADTISKRLKDMVSIRLWVNTNHVFSLQRRSLKAIKDIQELIIAEKGPANTGQFISMLCKRLYERMDPVFSELNEKIDAIEERIIENVDTNERQSINSFRKQAIIFKRYIAPQKDIILNLINTEKKWIRSTNKRQLQENLNLITRHVENLDLIRERAQIIKDELVAGITDKMNKNMYMLSVITAIFFPLGFLTGLLGINVGGIPGTDNTNAFFIFCGILLGVILFQILLFKKLKWF